MGSTARILTLIAIGWSFGAANWAAADEPKTVTPAAEGKAELPSERESVQVRLPDPPDEDRPGREGAPGRARASSEVQEQLREMRQKIEELREAGKNEEAAEMLKQLGVLMQRAQQVRDPNRVDMMRRQIEELRRTGKTEQAEELELHLKQILSRDRERPEGEPDREPGREGRGGPGPGGREDTERRLHHLRQAAENLEAAGLHDLAEQLRRQADELAGRRGPDAEIREPGPEGRGRFEGRRPGPEGRRPPGEGREGPPEGRGSGPEIRGEVQELRANMQQLGERMERLEQLIRRLAERTEQAGEKGDRE